jgi:hypothetical protein
LAIECRAEEPSEPCRLERMPTEFYSLYSGAAVFTDLTVRRVDEYCIAYFKPLNSLFPLLDPDTFLDEVVARLLRDGYKNGDSAAVLGLLVFALGGFAIGSNSVECQGVRNDDPTGFDCTNPPGSGFFEEACRWVGTLEMQDSLEKVQISLMPTEYLGAVSRNPDFYTSTTAASAACIFLLKTSPLTGRRLGGIS